MIKLIYNNLIAQNFCPMHKGSQIDSEKDGWRSRSFIRLFTFLSKFRHTVSEEMTVESVNFGDSSFFNFLLD